MTAEVAIINRQAIALAADSAVTATMFDKTKIYNSANKLFALSKSHPVGIMIYGSATLTGVPWETLIKLYRRKLGDTCFPQLKDYCDDFINFLSSNLSFFRKEDQIEAIQISAYNQIFRLSAEITNRIAGVIRDEGQISKADTKAIVIHVIEEVDAELDAKKYLASFNESARNEISRKYKDAFNKVIEQIFGGSKLTQKLKNKLLKIAANSVTKDDFSPNSSGIVIAGFGEDEVYPNLYTYQVELVLDGKLKYQANEGKSYTSSPEPTIIPFAQEDMIFTFVEGIDPGLQLVSIHCLDRILKNYFEALFTTMKAQNAANHQNLNDVQSGFSHLRQQLVKEFIEETQRYRQDNHILPILNIVNILPKEELAAMAESLVSLTSLKRRVSASAETVGGPTDVALISKGDGFVWVRRKHYFDPEINPDFFVNRFGSMMGSYNNKGR